MVYFTYFLLILAVVFIVSLVIYLKLNRKIERNNNPKYLLREIRDEIDRMIVELNQTTAQNIELIEDRIDLLKRLIEKADKRIALLKHNEEKNLKNTRIYAELGRKKFFDEEIKKGRKEKAEENVEEKVLNMYKSGFAESLIAKEVGLTIGEVQLIISLNRKGLLNGK